MMVVCPEMVMEEMKISMRMVFRIFSEEGWTGRADALDGGGEGEGSIKDNAQVFIVSNWVDGGTKF